MRFLAALIVSHVHFKPISGIDSHSQSLGIEDFLRLWRAGGTRLWLVTLSLNISMSPRCIQRIRSFSVIAGNAKRALRPCWRYRLPRLGFPAERFRGP